MKWANRWTFLFWIVCISFVLYSTADAKKDRKRVRGVGRRNSSAVIVKGPYSHWTKWGRCTRKCVQKRRRRCVHSAICGTEYVQEERTCSTGRCLATQKPNDEVEDGNGVLRGVNETVEVEQYRNELQEGNFRILFHLNDLYPYSEWGGWSPCSDDCLTRRNRRCQMETVCGTKVEEETSICYFEGTPCHRMYGGRRRRKKSGQDNGQSEHHPLEGLQCGVSPMVETMPDVWNKLRIIGGRESRKGSWPWQLALLNKHREPFCGATLIAPDWALTAAHCLRRKLIVRSGEHDLMWAEGTEQESPVAEQFAHPDYDENTVHNDIALLRLQRPFVFDNHTQPICLPQPQDSLEEHSRAVILGWGKRKSTAIYGTDRLHQAEVPIVDPRQCRKSYKNYPLTQTMLCAGYRMGRVDSCAGDSGGPLLVQRKGRWTLFGITSFGDGCGEKGKFGIYSSVPKFIKWIKRKVQRNSVYV